MRFAIACAFSLGVAAFGVQAPRAPRTDVYLASLSNDPAPVVKGPIVDISQSPGYDNQPSYLPDGSAVLFTSDRIETQTDIFRYDLATKTLTRLTHDPANEYSPLVMPGGASFSVVHGEEQSLWSYPLEGGIGHLLYQHKGKIGYHVWIDATHVGLFVLGEQGEPDTLQIADVKTGAVVSVTASIGRSLLMRPGTHTMSFVDKSEKGRWMVKTLDPESHTITPLVETPPGSEDCAWDPTSGDLLMASGAKILGWSPTHPADGWRTLGDLASDGVTKITRLAVSPLATAPAAGRLAFVAEPR